MPERTSNSTGATYLTKQARIEALRQAARRATQRVPEIRSVIPFGSLASGIRLL